MEVCHGSLSVPEGDFTTTTARSVPPSEDVALLQLGVLLDEQFSHARARRLEFDGEEIQELLGDVAIGTGPQVVLLHHFDRVLQYIPI
jgi:hypothetical protein